MLKIFSLVSVINKLSSESKRVMQLIRHFNEAFICIKFAGF